MRQRIYAITALSLMATFLTGTIMCLIGKATSDITLGGIGFLTMVTPIGLAGIAAFVMIDVGVKEFEEYDTGW
jgi:hypothetical protein